MYEIEKNIPVQAHGNSVYPFASMEPGDSFFVPDGDVKFNTVRRAVAEWGQRKNVKMTARKAPGGLRVWRVA